MKKANSLRLVSIILLLATALPILAGCNGTPAGTTPSGEDTSTPPAVTTPDSPDSSIPDGWDDEPVKELVATPSSVRRIGGRPYCFDYSLSNGGYSIPIQKKKKTVVEFVTGSLDAAGYADAFIGFHILASDVPYYLRAYVSATVYEGGKEHTDVQYGSYSQKAEDVGLVAGGWCWVEIPLEPFVSMKGNCTCEAGGGSKHSLDTFASYALTSYQIVFDDQVKSTLAGDTSVLLTNVGIYTRQNQATSTYKGEPVPAAFMLSLNLKNTTATPTVTAGDYSFSTTVTKGQTANLSFSFDKADVSGRDDAFVGFLVRTNELASLKVGVSGSKQSDLYAVPNKTTFGTGLWSWVEVPLSAIGNAPDSSSLSGITIQANAGEASGDVALDLKYVGVYSYKAAEETITTQPVPVGSDISSTYEWDHVLMGCYGFVCGMAIHPKDPTVMYVWTDVGGMYRWDPANERWIQLMDVLGYEYTDFKAVSGVALDPEDPNVVYVACGDNNNKQNLKSDILKSTDRGNTWTMTNFAEKIGSDTPIYCYNRTTGRAVGDPLVIDPNNSQIMYFGTMENGFYRSTDQGESWTKISSIPNTGACKGGVVNVYINPNKVKDGVSTDVYISFRGRGIYKSTDGGLTFQLMKGSPLCPAQVQVIEVGGKERLYATSETSTRFGCTKEENGSFWMYEDGTWTDLKPSQAEADHSFSSFLIDSRNPDVIILATAPWAPKLSLFRSTDGGKTFKRVLTKFYQASRLLQDPLNPDNVWIPYGGDVAYLYDFATFTPAHSWDKEPYLVKRGLDLETLCVTQIASLPGEQDAPILLLLMQDHGLRVQEELRVQAPDRAVEPTFHHGGGIDFCESDPSFVVRVGTDGSHDGGQGTAAYSKDSSRSYTAMNWDSSMRLVDCAVGAAKQENGFPVIMVYSVGRSNDEPDGSGVYRTATAARLGIISLLCPMTVTSRPIATTAASSHPTVSTPMSSTLSAAAPSTARRTAATAGRS